jgi:rhodanese-related sulfurtransferase
MNAKDFFEEKLRYEIDPAGVDELINGGSSDFIVVDVRSKKAFDAGHLPGAISMPIEEIEKRFSEIPKEKRAILYCYNISCYRAPRAALMLAKKGYEKVTEMIGGFEEWSKRGHRVEI